MNKQELLEAVGELNLVDTVFDADGVSYIDTAVSIMQVYDLINQLDEPKKVVIPKFVADEFDCNKNAYWEVDEAKDVAHVLKCAFGNEEKPSNFLDWVRENPEDYVMAVRNGYEVEKEKLYVVELSNDHLTHCLAYDLVCKEFFISPNREEKLNKYKKKFTEKEIKDHDERFWPFAVEVAE